MTRIDTDKGRLEIVWNPWSSPAFEMAWVAFGVEDGQDNDGLRFRQEMNRVREPTKQSSADLTAHGTESSGRFCDPGEHLVNGLLQLDT